MKNLEVANSSLNTIVKSREDMLQLTKMQYSEQVIQNTDMRRGLNDLYKTVVQESASSEGSEFGGMTPQLQMQLIQLINKVLNPSSEISAEQKKEEPVDEPPLLPSLQEMTDPQMQ